MQVNVFVSEVKLDGEHNQIWVFPHGPLVVIPRHLRDISWRYFATTESDNRLIGRSRGEVEVAIADDGYVLVTSELARAAR